MYTINQNVMIVNFFNIVVNNEVKKVRFNSSALSFDKSELLQDIEYLPSKRHKKPQTKTEVLAVFDEPFHEMNYEIILKKWLDENLDKLH